MISSVILCFSNPSIIALSETESLPYHYEGQTTKDGKYEGVGELFYKNKKLYEGEFSKNQFNGEGILYHVAATTDGEDSTNEHLLVNQKKYEGSFLEGKYHGKGTLYYKTAITTSNQTNQGIKYQGKFSHNQYNGYGIEYTMEGAIHREGYFLNGQLYEYQGNTDENGKMHGQGKLINNKQKIMFEGAFEHGEIHGQGILYNTNRTMRYEGQFVHDSLQGEGEIYVNDKLYYKGFFQDGLLSGESTLYLPNEKVAYKGPFEFNRTKEQPFQVKAELTLEPNMNAVYTLYIVLLADYLTDDTLSYLNSLEEKATPLFDKVQKDESKSDNYIALKLSKEIEDIDQIYYDELFGFNFVVNKTKLMIYEEYEVFGYLSVLHDPNLMNVSYEVNLPAGANDIRMDHMAKELITDKKYGWIDINDTNYKVLEFQRKNNTNIFISAAFFIILFCGIFYFRKKKKHSIKKVKTVSTTTSDTLNKKNTNESNKEIPNGEDSDD